MPTKADDTQTLQVRCFALAVLMNKGGELFLPSHKRACHHAGGSVEIFAKRVVRASGASQDMPVAILQAEVPIADRARGGLDIATQIATHVRD